MTTRFSRLLLQCLVAALCLVALRAHAEPYLAIQQGLKCGQCHVNPTGGGLRTAFGDVFAQTILPQQHLDTGTDVWTGDVTKFLRVGGDLRFDAVATQVPHSKTLDQFQMEQTRVYAEASVIPERLLVYVDEQVAPGGALNREAYGVYWSASHNWYVKAGQMYLPFGFRLEDQSAFIQTATGINMTTPDQGAEFGWEHGHWDAQFAVSNGTAGASTNDSRKQYSGQLIWVDSLWRVGAAANYNDKKTGSKSAGALFAGIRTGPVEWLAQGELIEDKSAANGGLRTAAGLVEADWTVAKGSNLKVTAEYLDPDRSISNNGQTRWSVIYEYSPIQFVQLRGGVRYSDGIPQIDSQHTRIYFVQLHGFF
jgi:hypothetical protein